ncbi:MAG: 4Fe-4S binding protein [Thermoguttaceae bacterium]|nr:4Fe-4S binding protein [Thermoguttaceae bacterium]MBO7723424.1 4Fe-4S binding protein [Thermoguttaceae bacterium]MBQ1454988.1 4Fe-4S binding protein [Thermoguttaceae bacterium]MBQ2683886.1 4Fe-4S binding protein [Thermoguttaceae bacterium]MBQ3333853.1 4Fe-4S binding protein [Thermoguttaceae bacterium]
MAAIINQDECVGCGACADACPCGAITVDDGKAKVNGEECAGCGACVDACPMSLITIE